MVDKIEVYIRNEEVVTGQAFVRPVSEHPCLDRVISKTQRVIPEADRMALEVVSKFANEKGLNVEVYDVSTFKGRLKASLKGIRTTPAIIIGKVRIEGEHASEQLKSRLEPYLSQ